MMFASFLFLLFLTDGVKSERICSYQDVLNYLNLTKKNELFTMSRPVKNYKNPTLVSLEVLLYAILDVVEKDQKFIPYVWTVMRWHNDYISWDPKEFCGIDNVTLPAEVLWMPDLIIEEMTEKDKGPPTPYLTINDKGYVEIHNDRVLVSTCRMRTYQFPFDIQRCNLSFKSFSQTAKDMRLLPADNSSEATEWSHEVMRTQQEWLFINMKVTIKNASDSIDQDTIIYTITMKRRSVLYIINFLLPILFFLFLDLSSFLILDSGGEKLSFKITVLLSVTVLQLILNEILPSNSDRIPLIAVYCIGIFTLMMLSLLETILVMFLLNRDSSTKGKTDRSQSLDERKWTVCICKEPVDEIPGELLKHGSGSQLTEELHAFEKLSEELREVVKTLAQLLDSRKEEEKPGYWTRKTQTINKVFFICYVTAAIVFLIYIFVNWSGDATY